MLREQKLKFAVMPLHGPDDDSFQNLKLNYVERTKIIICSNAVIWSNKVIGSVKRRFEDDSHEDIVQAAYKVLNSWRVMEEIPKENMRRSGCETEHFEEIATMVTTSKAVMMTTSKVMITIVSIVTMTTRMT